MPVRLNSYGNLLRANFLISAGITLVVTLFWIWGFNTSYFIRRDAYDYGQLTAELTRGHGFSTLQIFPRHVSYFSDKDLITGTDWPNLYRSPLVPVVSGFFNFFFESLTFSLIFQSGFWYLASIPLFFWLVLRATNLKVAIASDLLFAANPTMIRYSYSGMTEMLGVFLILVLIILTILPGSRSWKWFFLGMIAGLAYLARSQFIVFFPLVLLFAWLTARQLPLSKPILLVFFGLASSLAPWMIRNALAVGDPFFSFTTSRNFVLDAIPENSDLEMQLHAPVELSNVLGEYGQAVQAKFIRNIRQNLFSPSYWTLSMRGLHPILLLLSLASLIGWELSYSPEHRRLYWIAISTLLSTFLLVCLTVYSARYYLPFYPLVIVLGVAFIFALAERLNLAKAATWLILPVIMLFSSQQFVQSVLAHKYAPPDQSSFDLDAYAQIQRIVPPQSLIAADISERISFFTGRRTLRLPSVPAELLVIDQGYLPVDYVLLSKGLDQGDIGDPSEPGYHETYLVYNQFVESPEFLKRFTLRRRLANGSVLYQRVSRTP